MARYGFGGFKLREPKWVDVNDRVPDEGYMVHLKYVYENGNSGVAAGYYDPDREKWEIEYADDHPQNSDIKYWLDD